MTEFGQVLGLKTMMLIKTKEAYCDMHMSVLQMVILCPNSSVATFLTVTYV